MGGYENFLMDREWARKKIEKPRVGVKIFLPRKFSLSVFGDSNVCGRVGRGFFSPRVEWAAKIFS